MATFRKVGADYDAGLRAPHYTNGRLLTAEDLQRDQQATLDRLALLGTGVGTGVIEGFGVTAIAAGHSLRVTAGVGITPKGDAVRLATESVTLPVQPASKDAEPLRRSGRFEACRRQEGDPTASIDSGAYLLTVSPAARFEGSAPRYTCDGAQTATCANQWEVEGVEFKIIRLADYKAPTGNRSKRNRNLLAHWFYGSAALDTLMQNPFDFDQAYNGFAQIDAADLTDCDLPLAAFFWSGKMIDFVDKWAVQRRLHHPYPAADWRANISDQRVAEGEARFLQFQRAAADLQQHYGAKTQQEQATTHFAYLPPVGLLPINPFELVVTEVFEQILADNKEIRPRIVERGFTVALVRDRVRATLLNDPNQGNVFSLTHFFGDLLPLHYNTVHEDLIHTRLHQSWVQPVIQLPAPLSAVAGAKEELFEVTAIDNSSVSVTEENLAHIILTLHPEMAEFGLTLIDSPRVRAERGMRFAARPAQRSALSRGRAARLFRRNVAAEEAELTGAARAEAEPLVDILVLEELVAPYRAYLQEQMTALIESALVGLIAGANIGFVGEEFIAAVNGAFAHELRLYNWLSRAANRGAETMVEWARQGRKQKHPLFYVAFVRHHRASEPQRLRDS